MITLSKTLALAVAVATLAGCASNPDKIDADYVPASKYSGKSCDELDALFAKNHNAKQKLNRQMQSASKKTKAVGWVGALVFWPALFFMEGKDVSADEALAMYKGNEEAIKDAMDDCGSVSTAGG